MVLSSKYMLWEFISLLSLTNTSKKLNYRQ